MAYLGFIPTATILPYAGASAPEGWLVCDGQAVSRTTFASLYAALGGAASPFGQGDGSTTFNLPDLRGRFPRFDDNMGSHGVAGVTAAGAASRDTGRAHGTAQTQTTATNGLSGTAAGQTQGTSNISLSSGSISTNSPNIDHTHTTTNSNLTSALGAVTQYPTGTGSSFHLPVTGGTGSYASTGMSANTTHSHSGSATGTTNIAHTHASSAVTVTGDTETRPINISINAIIKI